MIPQHAVEPILMIGSDKKINQPHMQMNHYSVRFVVVAQLESNALTTHYTMW